MYSVKEMYINRYSVCAHEIPIDEIGDEIEMEDRHGGTPEMYAFSEIFKVPILIYEAKKMLDGKYKHARVYSYSIEKNAFFKLKESINLDKYQENYPEAMRMLHKETRLFEHFQCLYPNF